MRYLKYVIRFTLWYWAFFAVGLMLLLLAFGGWRFPDIFNASLAPIAMIAAAVLTLRPKLIAQSGFKPPITGKIHPLSWVLTTWVFILPAFESLVLLLLAKIAGVDWLAGHLLAHWGQGKLAILSFLQTQVGYAAIVGVTSQFTLQGFRRKPST